jgi:hypothetical protein
LRSRGRLCRCDGALGGVRARLLRLIALLLLRLLLLLLDELCLLLLPCA